MRNEKKHINVVAAVIMQNDKVFCFRKGEAKFDYLSNKFEFPGGKIEPGENPELALKREIKEELGVKISVVKKLNQFDFEYPDFKLNMTSFICVTENIEFHLTEHVEIVLESIDKLETLDWLPADRPVVRALQEIPIEYRRQ